MKTALLMLLLCVPVLVWAQTPDALGPAVSGNDFLAICDQPKTDNADFACAAWISGLLAGFIVCEVKCRPIPFDIPKDITVGQAQMIAVKFMKNNPEMLHQHACFLIEAAFSRAFPPKQKK